MRQFGFNAKLTLFIATGLFSFILYAGFEMANRNQLAEELNRNLSLSQQKMAESHVLLEKVDELLASAQGILIERDPDIIEKKLSVLKNQEDELTKLVADCGTYCGEFGGNFRLLKAAYQKSVDYALQGSAADAFAYFAEDVSRISEEIRNNLRKFRTDVQADVQSQAQELKAKTESRLRSSIGAAMVGAILYILLGILFSRSILSTLKSLSSSLSRAGESMNASSSQLSDTSQQVSEDASRAAGSLQDMLAALHELSVEVQNNSKDGAQSATLAGQSAQVAAEGVMQVQQLIASIKDLYESSEKVRAISGVLGDIAFQTNLLALNAAVEAARAGDAGRGFAVVAEAVRSLAQKSASSSSQISKLISENTAKIQHSTKLADQSGHHLGEILNSVKNVSTISHRIAEDGKRQALRIISINKAMNEFDQSIQSNAATSHELAASSENLIVQSVDLSKAVQDLARVI